MKRRIILEFSNLILKSYQNMEGNISYKGYYTPKPVKK